MMTDTDGKVGIILIITSAILLLIAVFVLLNSFFNLGYAQGFSELILEKPEDPSSRVDEMIGVGNMIASSMLFLVMIVIGFSFLKRGFDLM